MMRFAALTILVASAATDSAFYCGITQDIIKGDYFWSTIGNGSGTISEAIPLLDLTQTGSVEPGISAGAPYGKFYIMSGNTSLQHALYVIDPAKKQHGFLPVLLPGWEAYAVGNLNIDTLTQQPVLLLVGRTDKGEGGAVLVEVDSVNGTVTRLLADVSSSYRTWTQFIGGVSAWDGARGMYYTVVQPQGVGGKWELVAFNTSIPAGQPGAGTPAFTVSLPNSASWLMALGVSPVLAAAHPGTLGLIALVIDEGGDGSALWMLGQLNSTSPAAATAGPAPPAPWVSLHSFSAGLYALPNPGNYQLSVSPQGDTAVVLLYQLFANQTGTEVAFTMEIDANGSVRQAGSMTQIDGEGGVLSVTALASCPQ